MALDCLFDLKTFLEGTCRACSRYFHDAADGEIKFSRIFAKEKPHEEVIDIFEELEIWNLNIKPNDGLPQQFCQDCVQRFRNLKLFREECLDTQRVLQSYFKDFDALLESASLGKRSPISESNKSEPVASPLSHVFNHVDLIDEISESPRRLSPFGSPKFQDAVYEGSSLGTPPPIFEEIKTEPIDVKTMEYIKAEADLEHKPETEDIILQPLQKSPQQQFLSSGDESSTSTTDDELEDYTRTVTDIDTDLESSYSRNKHVPINPLQCKICLLNFGNRSKLRAHRLDVHPQEKPYSCNICASTFKSNFLLSQHKLKHNRPDSIKCEQCGKYFRSQLHLQRHDKNFHLTSTYTCNICHEKLENFTQIRFQYHVRQHGEKRFHCQFCEKSFHQKIHLINHERSHTKEQPFRCNICGKSFRQQIACQEHMLTHTDPTPFKCKICLKGFTQRSSLRLHFRTHSGNQPYHCEHCGKNFAQKAHYEIHQITHTSGAARQMQFVNGHLQKPRTARNRQFCDKSYLMKQMQHQHNEPLHFKCNFCNETFMYRASLTQHMRSHLNDGSSD